MSTNLFADQITMLRAFRQTTGEINTTQAALYLKLMCEEFGETLAEANPTERHSIDTLIDLLSRVAIFVPEGALNVVNVFDGLLDLLVVTINAGHSLNLPMQAGWDEVLRSNMAKVDRASGTVILREDGKVLKPATWTPPDLISVLNDCKTEENPITGASAFVPPQESLSLSDRYLNLALQHLGSAITTIGNLRQRNCAAGPAYNEATFGLSRAIFALLGKAWEPPLDINEREELARLRAAAKINAAP